MAKLTVGFPFKIAATGTQVTTGASAHTAIPNDSTGARARVVRISIAAATGFAYIVPSQNTGTVTVSDMPIVAGEAVFLDVRGFSHIGTLQGTAAILVNITPVDG